MSDAWKRLDLSGGGLQEANLRLAAALRRRRTAYLLWLAFPLGAHRAYLHDRAGAWAFRLGSAAALGLLLVDLRAAAALALALFAVASVRPRAHGVAPDAPEQDHSHAGLPAARRVSRLGVL